MNRRKVVMGGAALVLGGGAAVGYAVSRSGSPRQYADAMAHLRRPMASAAGDLELVRMATLAANGHNTQPWRFRIRPDGISIRPDFSRRTPVVDPDDHHVFASLGCAVANLSVAAGAQGRGGEVHVDPASEDVIRFTPGRAVGGPRDMAEAIIVRQSSRNAYDGRALSAEILNALERAAQMPGVDLALITDGAARARVRDLVVAGNSAQIADAAFRRELKAWLRFSPRQALARGDGLYTGASGNVVAPSWLGGTLFDLFFKAGTENEKYARQIDSSAGIAVFAGERADPAHWIQAGRACQAFALKATALGLSVAFINQPVEVAGLRPEMAALAGLPGRRPDIVMRFGYGPPLPYSPRRPVEAVLDV